MCVFIKPDDKRSLKKIAMCVFIKQDDKRSEKLLCVFYLWIYFMVLLRFGSPVNSIEIVLRSIEHRH